MTTICAIWFANLQLWICEWMMTMIGTMLCYEYEHCRTRNFMSMSQYRFLFALQLYLSIVHIRTLSPVAMFMSISLQLFMKTKVRHWTTHTKYQLAKIPPIPKGFAYEKGVSGWKDGSCCCLKQCAAASFATRQRICRKNFVFFCKKIDGIFVGIFEGWSLSFDTVTLFTHQIKTFKGRLFQISGLPSFFFIRFVEKFMHFLFFLLK